MYKQTLYKIIKPVKLNTLKRLNKSKKWEYGYNKENDVVVISKNGTVGEVLEIQGFKIALPKAKNVYKFKNNKWSKFEYPKVLSKIKTVFDFKDVEDPNICLPGVENELSTETPETTFYKDELN